MKEATSLRRRGSTEPGCMGCAVQLLLWIFCCLWSVVEAQPIDFTTKPANFSSDVSPVFAFAVVAGANGVDPCATSPCTFQCKLDELAAQDCSGRTYSAFNLTEGPHQLDVSATTNNGTSLGPSIYTWLVDSVPPTAILETNRLLTSAINITVNVTFSETCPSFQCSNTSCDVVVLGPAVVIPSTFVALSPGLSYSVQVGLLTLQPEGKVTLTTARRISCSDVAGNRYQRSANSSKVVRFSRIQPTLNLWTPIPNLEVKIGDQIRTVQATNVLSGEVPIYLDFSDPMVANVSEIQNLLNTSHGVLVPRARKSHSNRRFAFSLLLNTNQTAAVTIRMPGNTTVNRYGVSVPETTTVSFLYDTSSPEVFLNTNSRAHTRDRLLPFVVQFTKPVFPLNNLSITLSGGIVQSFKEISRTTYAFVVWASESSGPVAISVAGNQTQDVAGNANIASSTLQVKHYSSTPAIAVALYSFITAGLLGTAFFSGALAVSSANLAAAGSVLGRSRSCPGADASRNLLGMAGHMQVLALTGFLAVSLPVEYAETVNGLQWLIPHVSTPWQNNDATNYTSTFAAAASNVPTTNLSLSRRGLLSSPHGPDRQALFTACQMHHWSTPYGNVNCSLYSESLAPTYWSGSYMEDFWNRGQHELEVHKRRRLGPNGTEFGPAMDAVDYETYFLVDQIAGLNKLKEELLKEKFTGWRYLLRNIFWLVVIFGSLILLHFLLLLFLRWRMKSPIYTALSFPRFELFLLILAIPPICQAAAFVIRGGTKAGIIVGVILLLIPALLLLMTMWLLIFGIFLGKRVQYKELRPHLQQDSEQLPPPPPLSFLTGAGYPGKWTRKETTNSAFIPRFGILFEDRKGPPRLVTMIDDTNAKKTATTTVFRRPGINSDEEQDERTVSPAYSALGCFQSAYILVDLSRRIALGLIFGAFRVTDKSWPQVSLVLAVTAAQLLYLVATKPFQRRFVQVVETVSLLCEIGIFIVAMVILAHDRPYDSHWGLGVLMVTLFVVSFLAQMTNEWFALIRQLLWFSNTEEIAPVKSVKAFILGLAVPILPRSQWPRNSNNNTAPAATTTTTTQQPTTSQTPVPATAATSEVASSSRQTSPTHAAQHIPARVVGGSLWKSAKPVPMPEEAWPGEDLQEWARQNSLERNRSEIVAKPMVQTIAPAKHHTEEPATTAASRTYLRQYSIDIEP